MGLYGGMLIGRLLSKLIGGDDKQKPQALPSDDTETEEDDFWLDLIDDDDDWVDPEIQSDEDEVVEDDEEDW